ncbi:MAG TPA: squalene/phytoene synthase family protein [Anaerolineae bacterium]
MLQPLVLSPRLENAVSLDEAYTFCADVTREHSKSFYFSTRFLPAEKRRAIRAFYAFCRATDDMVDCPEFPTTSASTLAQWRLASRLPGSVQQNAILSAWADTRDRYEVPQQYVEELIDGCKMDLCVNRYETFDDLYRYCYLVASTVGLVSMHIIGLQQSDVASVERAKKSAIMLGVALQLTNILRDVGEDLSCGRIYLPQEDLRRFHYTEHDLRAGVIDERFRALMRFQIARAHDLYERGWQGIGYLRQEGRLAVGAAISLYRSILDRIVQNGYNVFSRRAHLSALAKLARMPGIYVRVMSVSPETERLSPHSR